MKKLFYVLAIVYFTIFEVAAQCAMCRATVETHARTGENKVAGLNTAILYLLIVPYACAGIFWYLYKSHKRKINEQNRAIKDRIVQAGK